MISTIDEISFIGFSASIIAYDEFVAAGGFAGRYTPAAAMLPRACRSLGAARPGALHAPRRRADCRYFDYR